MTQVEFIINCKITNPEGFTAIARELSTRTHKEAGCIKYDWFANDEVGVIHEIYTNADAVLEHLGNVENDLPRLMETCNIESLNVLTPIAGPAKDALDGMGANHLGEIVRKQPLTKTA